MSEQISEKTDNTPPPLNPLGTEEGVILLAQQKRNTGILWAITILLVVVAAAVFFVLPSFVSPPELDVTNSSPAGAMTSNGGGGSGAAPALSPFEEAQRMREREAAQDVLSGLLDMQESLEERRVTDWAEEEYQAALDLATQGDEAYRQQQFTNARAAYQEAADMLQALNQSIPARVSRLLSQGNEALEAGDSARALASFELAMHINPENEDAVNGIERARVLDDVLALMAEAEAAEADARFEDARELYRSAQRLDPAFKQAGDRASAMSRAITNRDFQNLMTQGYQALRQEDVDRAESRFEQALALRPGAEEAVSALELVRDQEALKEINGHLAEARASAEAENWQEALDAYNAALVVDPAIADAQQGKAEAQSRLNLDNYFTELLDDPLVLSDQVAYERGLEVYSNALNVPNGGPRFREQMDQVKHYLEQARIPRTVQINSDGLTVVSLARRDSLGQFSTHNLDLYPGRYALIGYRTGFKDVRVEFEVDFDEESKSVTVIASEPVR